jgi:hypothetical protein
MGKTFLYLWLALVIGSMLTVKLMCSMMGG